MIREVDVIPDGRGQKQESYRQRIRDDMQEAIDKGIKRFEFIGDYNYRYLAKYVREEAERLMRNVYIRTVKEHQEEFAEMRLDWWGIRRQNSEYITVRSTKGEEPNRPHVYCEIGEGTPDEYMLRSIREWLAMKAEIEKAREAKRKAREKLKMAADDVKEEITFAEVQKDA